VHGKSPWQYGFDFGWWTRTLVQALVAERFAVAVSLTSIGSLMTRSWRFHGALLARVGLTVQKPLQRAYQRDPVTIPRWRRETYPALVNRARKERADVAFWDESGFRADAVHGMTWSARDRTPVVHRPAQRPSISAASAVSSHNAFWFRTCKGGLNGLLFVTLLQQLLRGRKRPLHLVLDSLPAHKTKIVTDHVATTNGRLPLHVLPVDAPVLNPDDLI